MVLFAAKSVPKFVSVEEEKRLKQADDSVIDYLIETILPLVR